MRYFAELAYNGTRFHGWQRQPESISVQEVIEDALSTLLRQKITVTGCGRTDTGVHARQYFLHFDSANPLPENLVWKLNSYLNDDIAFYDLFEVAPEAHARFDANSRSYEYHLELHKNPFSQETAFYYPQSRHLDFGKMQEAADLLLNYEEFFPFCKSHTDVKTMRCELSRAEWIKDMEGKKMVFHISANRFLRGMVRLIVGMCLSVGVNKYPLSAVKEALDKQERLQKSWSVPPQGLFLTDIRYPFLSSGSENA